MNDQNIPVAAHITVLKPQNPTPKTFILPSEVVLTRKMYYDKSDKEQGDGFYPQLVQRMNRSYGSDITRNDIVNINFRGPTQRLPRDSFRTFTSDLSKRSRKQTPWSNDNAISTGFAMKRTRPVVDLPQKTCRVCIGT